MLIWINGSYGAGKTTVARHLAAAIPGAALVDPEQLGTLIQRMLGLPKAGDFQDEPLWREFTVKILVEASSRNKVVIVPMALLNPSYFDEVMRGLNESAVQVRHFALLALLRTLERRLFWRLDFPRSRRWAISHARQSADALRSPRFAVHVETDGRTPSEVSLEILERVFDRPREGASSQPGEAHELPDPRRNEVDTEWQGNELPRFIQREVAQMGEHSYGVNLVTVKLKDGTVIPDVYVGWARDVIKVGTSGAVNFDASEVVAVKHQASPYGTSNAVEWKVES